MGELLIVTMYGFPIEALADHLHGRHLGRSSGNNGKRGGGQYVVCWWPASWAAKTGRTPSIKIGHTLPLYGKVSKF